jgi:hypothetical protein
MMTTTKKNLAIFTNTGMARSFDQPIDAGSFGGCSSLEPAYRSLGFHGIRPIAIEALERARPLAVWRQG